MTEKLKYNFYLSYWDSFKMLSTDKEKVEYITLINKIHFFEEHIDRVIIKNSNVKLLFASIKHSLKSSIQGYCDKKGIDYDSLFTDPCKGATQPPIKPPCEQLISNNKQLTINNKKETIDKKEVVFEDIDNLIDLFKFWSENKTGSKFKNKGSYDIAYKKFLKLCNNDLEVGRSIIEYSIAGAYQGLFELKQNKKSGFSSGERNL